MTTQTVATGIPSVTEADVDALIARSDAPQWLAERRRTAWRTYAAMDLPDPGDEEWRRTDVRALDFSGLMPAVSRDREFQQHSDEVQRIAERDGRSITLKLQTGGDARWSTSSRNHVVQVGSLVLGAGSVQLEPRLAELGVVFTSLREAVSQHESLVREKLYSAVAEDWKFVAANSAAWSDGCFLYVPPGVEVEVPLEFVQTTAGNESMFQRTLIVADHNSKLTFVDQSDSGDARALISSVVEIFVGDGAKVEYYDVNNWGENVLNFKTVRAVLGRDAEFLAMAAGIGSKVTKMRIDAEMPQAGARVTLLGVTFGDGSQHFDYNTLQNHVGKSTISDLQFKSALTDSASLVWYGITRINETAGGSEANQTSRNLLLSEHAKAAPIPILEIKAHDVSKCSHGATVGPVDENELFYLQARAIPRDVAERMLVEGYFASVVDRIPNAALRARIMTAMLAKAGGGAGTLTYDEVIAAK